MTIRRYLQRPKGQLIVVFTILAVAASIGPNWKEALASLGVAVAVAIALDAPILRAQKGQWAIPDGAFLTGVIVSMVLARQTPLHVVAITSGVAILSKHLFRIRTTNIFNPAALALFATYFVFLPGQDWWGSIPDGGPFSLILLAATGLFIAKQVNKLALLVAFLGAYYALFTGAAYFGDPMIVAGVFRGADLHAVLYFAFFMVTDPPTSPPKPRDQIIFGIIAAVGCFAVRETVGAAYFILVGLLVANIWEAQRRVRAHTTWQKHHAHAGAA